MRKKALLTLIVSTLALCSIPVTAQPTDDAVMTHKELQAAKEIIDTKRDMALIVNLDLTEAENKEFWPLYEEYRAKIRQVRERKVALVEAYAERYRNDTVDDDFADSAIKDALAIQRETVKIRQRYWKKFKRIIPVQKAARFYQLENKMDAGVDFVLAGGVPLVEAE